MPVISLSSTAAWLYSWYASAFWCIASASAWPLARTISASAVPCRRVASAWPAASICELLALRLGQHLDALALGLGRLGHGRLELEHAALHLQLLDPDLLLALDLLDPHLLGHDLLLGLVGRDVVGLLGQRRAAARTAASYSACLTSRSRWPRLAWSPTRSARSPAPGRPAPGRRRPRAWPSPAGSPCRARLRPGRCRPRA